MQLTGLPEGTPILCRACGAPSVLADTGELRCQHCGAAEQLPADALGRVLEIKNRLSLAASRAAQASGMDRALGHIYEDRGAWLRVTGLYLTIALLSMAMGVVSLWGAVEQASTVGQGTEVLLVALPGMLAAPMLLLGGCIGVAVALTYGGVLYRRDVRPLLLASPPAYQGAPFGCRACGGALPMSRDIDVACPYCRTANLVPTAWHGAHVSGLVAEAEARRASTHGASARSITLAGRVRTAFILTAAAWTFGFVVLPILVLGLLTKALYG